MGSTKVIKLRTLIENIHRKSKLENSDRSSINGLLIEIDEQIQGN
ncbi:MAG: hypothetical protein V1663_02010 [archaeon]